MTRIRKNMFEQALPNYFVQDCGWTQIPIIVQIYQVLDNQSGKIM